MAYDPGFVRVNDGLEEGYGVVDLMRAVVSREGFDARSQIASANGIEAMNGWDILTDIRNRFEETEFKGVTPFFAVVTTKTVVASYKGLHAERGKYCNIELMQQRSKGLYYWWEINPRATGKVSARWFIKGFEAAFYDYDAGVMFNVIISCPTLKEYEDTLDMLKKSESVEIAGMWIDASVDKRTHETVMIAQVMKPQQEDYSGADKILERTADWRQLLPMREVTTGAPFLPETVQLSMMMTALFYRNGLPALNTTYFGPSGRGKSATIRMLKDIMGGTMVAGKGSSGKGWLVSHKEGVLSPVLTEKNMLYVDEFFKSAADVGVKTNFHSWSMALNNFMENHMLLFERSETTLASGNGSITGRMSCSFIAAENDDLPLQKALARAYAMAQAPMRRFQFGYVDKKAVDVADMFASGSDNEEGREYMFKYFTREFGADSLKNIRRLYLFSRRFTKDTKYGPPGWWRQSFAQHLYDDIMAHADWVPKEFVPKDSLTASAESAKHYQELAHTFVSHHMNAMIACWVSAGVMRGWEVHQSITTLEPVFDTKQQQMAEDVAKYLLQSKMRVLAPGIDSLLKKDEEPQQGVARTGGFGSGRSF